MTSSQTPEAEQPVRRTGHRQGEHAEAADSPQTVVVDPSPTSPPIAVDRKSFAELLSAYPAPASPPEVLELKPNRMADAQSGPDPQISQTMYVHMTKPNGDEFMSPLSNVDYYERKGFKKGAEEDIPDLVAYQAERAKRDAG